MRIPTLAPALLRAACGAAPDAPKAEPAAEPAPPAVAIKKPASLPAIRPEDSLSAFSFLTDPHRVARSIKLHEVRRGVDAVDPRDKIRTILEPKHAAADQAPWVTDGSRVLGVALNGEARAYPLYLLQVHELANDVLGGVAIAPNY